jgi:hypothetical protein
VFETSQFMLKLLALWRFLFHGMAMVRPLFKVQSIKYLSRVSRMTIFIYHEEGITAAAAVG